MPNASSPVFPDGTLPDPEKLEANFEKIKILTERMKAAISDQKKHDPHLDGPDQALFAKAAAAYMQEMMSNPAKMIESQVNYWTETVRNFADAQNKSLTPKTEEAAKEKPADKRFKNEWWDTNPYFSLIKKQYLLSSQTMEAVTQNLDHLPPNEKERVNFFTKQFMDMLSPTNFLASNPDALQKAMETDGSSLVQGLENLVRDLENNPKGIAVTLSDPKAFTIGENIATSPGSIVYQNRIFQLIQYTPTTEKVHKTPLVIFPPWINKFYILDLKEKNSLIKFMVDQGHTVFVVSWVNPDESYRDCGFDEYLQEGLLTALAEVKSITGEKKLNVVGYCIAGTLLTCGLAYMAQAGIDVVNKATYFTTLTDFAEPGELGAYIEENFLDGIENEVMENGVLDSFFMSRAFSFLRANDLVYAPAVRSYMMGEAPPAFDLLHWNGDGTNMPAKMTVQYLRDLYVDNKLVKGEFHLLGRTLDMSDIKVPIFAVTAITDHIAPWESSFQGLSRVSGKKTFVLSESGHIAGVVNPPAANKYGHWVNPEPFVDGKNWLEEATFEKLSWWTRWDKWLTGGKKPTESAPEPGDESHPVLEPAPGSYVTKSYKRM